MAEIPINLLGMHVEGLTSEFVRDVAFRTLSAVVLATPVGNPTLWQNPNAAPPGYTGGRARGNWQVGIGFADDAETGQIDKSGSATISKARTELAGYRIGPQILIQNNVPYINRLNEGHSTQAPAMFVQRGIQTALNSVDSQGPIR